jgi:hypothetical protein
LVSNITGPMWVSYEGAFMPLAILCRHISR